MRGFKKWLLTEKADEVVVVVLADESVGDDRVERFNAVVPDGLATLGGSDSARLAIAA
jgi:hypothetical protein